MMRYSYDLHMWNEAYNELMTAEDTLDFYRTSYEDEVPKAELESYLASLDEWAKHAHNNKLLYNVFVCLNTTGQAYANLVFNEGNAVVSFLDDYEREYLIYTFTGQELPNKLFLESIHYFEYANQEWATPADSISDTQYVFTPSGELTIHREYYKTDGQHYRSKQAATQPVDITPNWEAQPVLGEYADLLVLKRWGEQGTIVPLPAIDLLS